MGKDSAIEWTDHSWNPMVGCAKVSAGCKNCYMFREQKRFGLNPIDIRQTKTLNAPLKWNEPGYVFACSWSDWFLPEGDPWRSAWWDVIRQTPHLTYQILTKRPQLIEGRLPADWGDGYDNVWLGVSVEDQEWLRRYTVHLSKIPAKLRFISAEPLLGQLDLTNAITGRNPADWVIVGGESGQNARKMKKGWAKRIVADCQRAGVAVFVKQLGGYPDKRSKMSMWDRDLQVRQMPLGADNA